MNPMIVLSFAVLALAYTAEAIFFVDGGATATTTTLTLGAGGSGAAGALLLVGGVAVVKALALGALVASRSRGRRSPVEVDNTDAAFTVLATSEPAQCYRRLICDLATGSMPKSENDVILSLFEKEASIESPSKRF